MYTEFQKHLQSTLQEIRDAGLYKNERVIITPQSSGIAVEGGQEVINFCANNYLGLADNKELIEAAKARMDARGYGMASVRFICGTQDTHKELERVISDFFGTEDTILYAACFDANGGLFEPLLTEEDAIISDALNHASIIDGVRLCKAVRYRYANGHNVSVLSRQTVSSLWTAMCARLTKSTNWRRNTTPLSWSMRVTPPEWSAKQVTA